MITICQTQDTPRFREEPFLSNHPLLSRRGPANFPQEGLGLSSPGCRLEAPRLDLYLRLRMGGSHGLDWQPTERGYVMTIIHFFQTRHSVLD